MSGITDDEFTHAVHEADKNSDESRKKIFDLIPDNMFERIAFVNNTLDALIAVTVIISNGDIDRAKLGMQALYGDADAKLENIRQEMIANPGKFFATVQ